MQMHLQSLEGMVNNMELKNTLDCANDLLLRMFLASTNKDGVTYQMLERNIPKFQSAVVIQSMIKRNHIIGHTNQEVYEMYSFLATELNLPLLSMIDLSRTLCKYYGFDVVDKKVNGKKVRMFDLKTSTDVLFEKATGYSYAEYFIRNFLVKEKVLGCRNSEIYDQYVKWCHDDMQPISRSLFSMFVCDMLDVATKTVKKDDITIRIYVEKVGADHGDNSSDQKGLG